jgi:hypothetical protein
MASDIMDYNNDIHISHLILEQATHYPKFTSHVIYNSLFILFHSHNQMNDSSHQKSISSQ